MELIDNAVHLWWASVEECPPLCEADYVSWFTQAERHALAQKIPKVRASAFFAKCFLKSILLQYVSQAPSELVFEYNAYGKPVLVGSNFHFNVSHSEHYVVLALCRAVPLGVDIQTMRQNLSPLAIAKRFFHEKEYDGLALLDSEAQRRGFYRLWSAKEAILKALGVGIGATGLKDVALLMPKDVAAPVALAIDMKASALKLQAFALQEFFWLPDCAFSLATCQATPGPQIFQWRGP